MRRRDGCRSRGGLRPGFSLIELLVALVLGTVVTLGVVSMFVSENGRLSQQRELSDTWLTLRSATEVLGYDLRSASPAGGDLRALTPDSFIVRSRLGSGVVCAKTGNAYALTGVTGDFSAATGDSIQVVTVQTTPQWRNVRVSAVGAPGSVGPASCVWAGSAAPAIGVRLLVGTAADTASVAVGSLMQSFRSTKYGIMTSSGRRWLGRKVSDGSWEVVTGPLRTDGLKLEYYTAAGALTTTPANVAAVRITLRGESYGRSNKQRKVMQDTISVRVHLRN